MPAIFEILMSLFAADASDSPREPIIIIVD
jgi:hypothetical protein